MTIFIVTECGRTLTDKAIHHLLDDIAKHDDSKKINWLYRCGPSLDDPQSLINQIDGVNDYKVVAYRSKDDWRIATEKEIQRIREISTKYSIAAPAERCVLRTGLILFKDKI